MRFAVLLAAAVALPSAMWGQAAASPSADLYAALRGDWVGVLEYRDYSEPVGSTKRVDLPTWLTVTGMGRFSGTTCTTMVQRRL